ncbi:hypothetical protein BS78_05G226900 [Paspalum vaginatum]|nr:hypothetical protein BS78_05G226900 [Paspalum vaginatum]
MAETQAMDDMLRERDIFLREVRDRLLQAQEHARCAYNTHHRDLEFAVGNWVWLRLLHRQALSLVHRPKGKLGPRYAGPFQVLEHIGNVAYRLQLPAGARIHDVFHVGLLKPFCGCPLESTPQLPPLENGCLLPVPERIWCTCLCRGDWHVLVQWDGSTVDQATWEPLRQFKDSYPTFQLEDELFLKDGRDVMTDKVYQRRNKPDV